MKKIIKKFKTHAQLSRASAEMICRAAETAVAKRGYFTLVLSGGGAPKLTYSLLAKEPYKSRIDWKNTCIFWEDERHTSWSDPMSLYAVGKKLFLNKVKIPAQNIFGYPLRLKPTKKVAAQYEKSIRKFFASKGFSGRVPSLDVIVAGIGPDGHTASLFPDNHKDISEKKKLIINSLAPFWALTTNRITMTFPLINAARNVLFIVADRGMAPMLKRVLRQGSKGALKGEWMLPASRVKAKEKLVFHVGKI